MTDEQFHTKMIEVVNKNIRDALEENENPTWLATYVVHRPRLSEGGRAALTMVQVPADLPLNSREVLDAVQETIDEEGGTHVALIAPAFTMKASDDEIEAFLNSPGGQESIMTDLESFGDTAIAVTTYASEGLWSSYMPLTWSGETQTFGEWVHSGNMQYGSGGKTNSQPFALFEDV